MNTELLAKKHEAEAEIAVANALGKGLALDKELVIALVALGQNFDRKLLSYLSMYKDGGNDPNVHLRGLKAKLETNPVEETKKAKRLPKALETTTEKVEIHLKRPDLRAYVNVEALQNLVDKATELIAANSGK